MGIIYKITSPSSKIYVGKTYDLRKRINAHKLKVRKGSSIILHNSIRKYGWDAHVLEVIEEVEDALLDEREIFWIAKLNTYCYENPMGLNMTKGGEGQRSTWIHDEKRRKEQSRKFKKEGNPFYGKTHSEEWKQKKSKEVSEYNKNNGVKIPDWGVEKGRKAVQKQVVAYDSFGEFISEYISLSECAKSLNVKNQNVKDSVCFGSWIKGKYLVKYKTENYPLRIDVGQIKTKTERRPVILMNEDLEPVIEFSCAEEASKFLGVPKTTINRAAQYNDLKPTRLGHVFLYRDMYDELFKEAV